MISVSLSSIGFMIMLRTKVWGSVLREWVVQPLTDPATITARLDAVEVLAFEART
jgi:DNA mismatch repair ATPase MutS